MSEPDYPPLLRHLANAPPILIVKGDISLLTRPSIGIVGARNSSAGAKKFAHKLGFELAEQGLTVVSGLARGIDSEAHKGAVAAAHRDRSNLAATIGVIASGIDIAYPPENAELQEYLATNALVVTEYPPGSEPVARHFPFRNRIIAGLSLATLVVEAAPRSGSLITARLANELGRQVLAIPGSPLDSRSAGCNGLIREGATLVRDVGDIVEAITPLLEGDALSVAPMFQQEQELCFDEPQAQEVKLVGEASIIASEERRDHIRNQLSQVAISPDELSILADCPVETVNAILVELEILGECERVAGGKIRAAST
jgi:DNA processing protein